MKNIDQVEFVELSNNEDYILLDVRRPDEWASGIIPNAMTINFMDKEKFASAIEKLDKDKHYLIYCRSGNRSGLACMMMDSYGFKDTYNLTGGMLEWNGPVVQKPIGV